MGIVAVLGFEKPLHERPAHCYNVQLKLKPNSSTKHIVISQAQIDNNTYVVRCFSCLLKNINMSKRKLDNEEIKHIAKLSNEVGCIGQIIISDEIEAYNYDWQQLSIKMKEVIKLFNNIKNK